MALEQASRTVRPMLRELGAVGGTKALLAAECRLAAQWLKTLFNQDAPTRCVAVVFAMCQLASVGWDLPSSFSWDNDGIAPRDIFAGVADNLRPGSGDRYPLLHYVIVGTLSLPFLLLGLLGARSFAFTDLRDAMLAVPVMTAVSLTARLVAVCMATIIVLVLSRMAARACSPRAGRYTALMLATHCTFGYYGRVSNLDVPYLFWTVLALERLGAACEGKQLSDYARFGVFAVAAIATKDQAYAAFVLIALGYTLSPRLLGGGALVERARSVCTAVGAGAVGYAVFSGALVNPTGFVTRFAMLTGPNSQDCKEYPATVAGVVMNLRNLCSAQAEFFWPWPVTLLAWAGVLMAVWRAARAPENVRCLLVLPGLAALSSLLCFTLVVARSEARFVLPLGVLLAFYGGIASGSFIDALAALSTRLGKSAARTAQLALVVLLAWSAAESAAVHLTQWGDSRRQVEAFLAALPKGSRVETYGLTVYQPRFDVSEHAPYRVTRIDKSSPDSRNPIPGVVEQQAEFGGVASRAPDVLVVLESPSERFVPGLLPAGMVRSPQSQRNLQDEDARRFFSAALFDTLPGYRQCLRAEPDLGPLGALLRPVKLHGSTGSTTVLLVRTH